MGSIVSWTRALALGLILSMAGWAPAQVRVGSDNVLLDDAAGAALQGGTLQTAIDEGRWVGGLTSGVWTFDTATADADPGSGKFRFDNAAPASATFLYVDDLDLGGVDLSVLLQTMPANGVRMHVQNTLDPVDFEMFDITGISIDGAGYWKIPVRQRGTGTGALALDDNATLAFVGGPQDLVNGINSAGYGNEDTLRFIETMTGIQGPLPNPLRRVYFSDDAGGDLVLGVDNNFCTISAPCLTYDAMEDFAERDDEGLWIILDAGDTFTAADPAGDWHIVPNAASDDFIWRRFSSTTVAGECEKYQGGICVGGNAAIDCGAWTPTGSSVMHCVGTGLGKCVWEGIDINCGAPLATITTGGGADHTAETIVIDSVLINSNATEFGVNSDGVDSMVVCLDCDITNRETAFAASRGSTAIMIGGSLTLADIASPQGNHAIEPGGGMGPGQAQFLTLVDVDIEQTATTATNVFYVKCDTNWNGTVGKTLLMKTYFKAPTSTSVTSNFLECSPMVLGSDTGVLVDIEFLQSSVQGFPRGYDIGGPSTDNSIFRLVIDGIVFDGLTDGFHFRIEDDWCDLAASTGATSIVTMAHTLWSSTDTPGSAEFRANATSVATLALFADELATCSANAGVTLTIDQPSSQDYSAAPCLSAEPEGAACKVPTSCAACSINSTGCGGLPGCVFPAYTRDFGGRTIPAWVLGRELKGFTFGDRQLQSYGARE